MIDRRILIRWTNSAFDIKALLREVGIDNPEEKTSVYCPFHLDEEGGKKSATILKDCLHCFSEAKQYRAYDVLVFLGYSDNDIYSILKERGPAPDSAFVDAKPSIVVINRVGSLKRSYINREISSREYTAALFNLFSEGISSTYGNPK